MKELLPFCAGLGVGGALALVRSLRVRALVLPVACVVLGALASWVNGELGTRWWAVFVSIDSLLVWAGAVAASVLLDHRVRALVR